MVFDLTSSHPSQEKKMEDPKAVDAEKVEKDFCSHCHFFFGCKSLIFFLGGVAARAKSRRL